MGAHKAGSAVFWALLFALYWGMCSSRALAAPEAVAVVNAKTGAALVQHHGVGPLEALNYGMTLSVGDIVRTGPTGSLSLEFADGSHFDMRAGSAVRIGSTAQTARRKNLVEVLLGAILAHLRPSETVGTIVPTTYIAARGTDVLVEVGADGTTTLTVTEGDAVLSTAQGAQDVPASEQSIARPGQAPTPPVVVDTTGLTAWTADVVSLPLEFELPPLTPGPNGPPNYPQEVAAFSAAAQAAPGDAAAWDNLGEAERGVGDVPAALSAFRKALAIGANNTGALVGIALVNLSQGRIDDARAILAPVQGQAIPSAVLGLADLHVGAPGDAAAAFGAALTQDPSLYAARALLALADLAQDRLLDAEAAARAAVQQQPNSAQTEGVLAMILFFENQTGAAEADARRAVRLNPQSPFALLTEGRALMAQQQTEAARVAYEKAAAAAPNLWIAHEELGAVYLRLDMPHQATEEYETAIRENPRSPSAADSYAGLGAVLAEQGKFGDALTNDRTAIGLDPASVTAHYNLATVLIEEGHLDEARRELETGLAADPDRGVLYARLAEVSLYRQDLAAAQDFAQRAVRLLPNSSFTHYELGRVYLEQQRNVQAEQEFRLATALDPDDTDARYALGLTEEKAENGLINSFSTLLDSEFIGSPADGSDLQNLQTPGANERVQAALENPVAVRVASRSYGNTEIDGLAGQEDSRDVAASYLDETKGGRGVIGANGEDQYTSGIRANDDSSQDTASITIGQKAADGPSDVLLLGDYQETDSGNDNGVTSNPTDATERFRTHVPRAIVGFNLQTGGTSRLLGLVQASDAVYDLHSLVDTDSSTHFDTKSFDGEMRWDAQFGPSDILRVGFSLGDRARKVTTDDDPMTPGNSPDVITTTSGVRPYQGYVRDEYQAGRRLSLVGQVQVQQLDTAYHAVFPDDYGLSPLQGGQSTTVVLPSVIASYQGDASSVYRLRVRRIMSTVEDFQLLTPTDEFLISYVNLPQPNLLFPIGDAASYEVEYDHAFRSASFLSLSAFDQQINQANITDAPDGPYDTAQLQGVQTSYQGILSRDVSFALRADLDRAEDTTMHQRIAQLPQYDGLITVQYLNPRGYYGQGEYYFQGDRVYEDYDENGNPASTRLGGFGAVSLRFGKRSGLRSDTFLQLNNVFNREYDVLGVARPGRLLLVGTTLRF